MNCDEIRQSLGLFLYGELSFDQEDLMEKHLAGCASCQAELGRERRMHDMLLDEAQTPSSPLLADCRRGLRLAVADRPSSRAWIDNEKWPWVWKPALAAALVAAGFFGARITQGSGDPSVARVRNVETDAAGRIHIVLDETRSRSLRGRIEDEPIQRALLSATRDNSDPGLRAETIDMLKGSVYSDSVRGALLHSLRNDSDPAVRMKALEGLKPYAGQPDVRKALTQTLVSDAHPLLRSQAIDLLTGPSVSSDVVVALQMLMRKEQDGSIRMRGEKLLQSVKASTETF